MANCPAVIQRLNSASSMISKPVALHKVRCGTNGVVNISDVILKLAWRSIYFLKLKMYVYNINQSIKSINQPMCIIYINTYIHNIYVIIASLTVRVMIVTISLSLIKGDRGEQY